MRTRITLIPFLGECENMNTDIGIIHTENFKDDEIGKLTSWTSLLNDMAGIIKEIDTRCSDGNLKFIHSMNLTFYRTSSIITNGSESISYIICFESASPHDDSIAFFEIDGLLTPTLYIGEGYDDIKLFSKNDKDYKQTTLNSSEFFSETETMYNVNEVQTIKALEACILDWYKILVVTINRCDKVNSENASIHNGEC